MTLDYLVLLHGITPHGLTPSAPGPLDDYAALLDRVFAGDAALAAAFPEARRVPIVWGMPHARNGAPATDDEWLALAQEELAARTAWPANVPGGVGADGDWGIPFVRERVLWRLRDEIVLRGLGDAVYYASPDGEARVRRKVFEAVLRAVGTTVAAGEVARIHVVAHSLGVAVAHDFLFGLFGKPGLSDYLDDPDADPACKALYQAMAARRRDGHHPGVELGSFAAMASQLPLFFLRKQTLVRRFAVEKKPLDPSDLGITGEGAQPTWLTFFDVDDVLAFPSRPLYTESAALEDVPVRTGCLPLAAHTEYWRNDVVAERVRGLLRRGLHRHWRAPAESA